MGPNRGEFFHGTTSVYRAESGMHVLTDELSPVTYWRFTVPEGEPPKDSHATVELRCTCIRSRTSPAERSG